MEEARESGEEQAPEKPGRTLPNGHLGKFGLAEMLQMLRDMVADGTISTPAPKPDKQPEENETEGRA